MWGLSVAQSRLIDRCETPRSLRSQWGFVIAAFVAFVLIAISLGALKAITSALDGRTVEIKRQLDESRQLREEAAAAQTGDQASNRCGSFRAPAEAD